MAAQPTATSRDGRRKFRQAKPTDSATVDKVLTAYELGRTSPWLRPKDNTLDWGLAIASLAKQFNNDCDENKLSEGLERLRVSLTAQLNDCVVGNCWQVWYGWYATICVQGTIKQHQTRDGHTTLDTKVYWHHGVELINTLVDQHVESHGAAALDIIACFASESLASPPPPPSAARPHP